MSTTGARWHLLKLNPILLLWDRWHGRQSNKTARVGHLISVLRMECPHATTPESPRRVKLQATPVSTNARSHLRVKSQGHTTKRTKWHQGGTNMSASMLDEPYQRHNQPYTPQPYKMTNANGNNWLLACTTTTIVPLYLLSRWVPLMLITRRPLWKPSIGGPKDQKKRMNWLF